MMAVDGIDGRRRGKREEMVEPAKEWADAGQNGRTCLARPNYRARTGTGDIE